MTLYRFELQLNGDFATAPKGDTLFGSLCWQIVRHFGEARLVELLNGYTNNNPFMIVSDFLIDDHIMLPPVPRFLYDNRTFDVAQRKQMKKLTAISFADLKENGYKLDVNLLNKAKNKNGFESIQTTQIRVKINRQTNTATSEGFDPFASIRHSFASQNATLYALIDTNRFSANELGSILSALGKTGFGKDATIGMGRFLLRSFRQEIFDADSNANAMLTLSPSVLSNQGFTNVFYEPFTRFGKHGDILANGNVWKNPILMADSFSLVCHEPRLYIGKGLGGDGSISKAMKQTVHQGYSISVPINFVRLR